MTMGPLLKLLFRLGIFVAPVIAGLGYSEWRLRSVPTLYDLKRQLIVDNGKAAEVVILGSSLAVGGLDPGSMPCPAINVALHGQTLDIDAALVDQYLPALPRMRVLIVPLAFFSLEAPFDGMPDHAWQLPLYGRSLLPGLAPAGAWDRWKGYVAAAVAQPRKLIEQALRRFPPSTRNAGWLGWEPLSANSDGVSVHESNRAARLHRTFMNPARREELERALRAIAARGRSVGAEVLFLVTPFHPNYRKAWTASEIADFRGRLAAIAQDSGALVADYSGDLRFSDPDFNDGSHLARAGAVRFSGMVAEEVVVLKANCAGLSGDEPVR